MQNDKFDLSAFIARTQLVFALPLPQVLRSLLSCYQYSISVNFHKKYGTFSKNKKKFSELFSKELSNAIKNMCEVEKIEFYYTLTDFIFKLLNGNTQFSSLNGNDLSLQGFVRNSKNLIWKKKQITYNALNHVIYIQSLKNDQKIVINLEQYLYRKSKNINYKAFVLQACNKRVPKDLRTLCIGFEQVSQFDTMFSKVKHSINYRQWEFVKSMYSGDPLTKNSINSMRRQSFCEQLRTQKINQDEQQFFTCQNFEQIYEQKVVENSLNCEIKSVLLQRDLNIQNQQGKTQKLKKNVAYQKQFNVNLSDYLKKSKFNNDHQWQILIENNQFRLFKNKHNQILHLQIMFTKFVGIEQLQNIFSKCPSNMINKIKKIGQNESKQILSMELAGCDQMINQTIFEIQRQRIEKNKGQIIYHQSIFRTENNKNIEYQATWLFSNIKKSTSNLTMQMHMKNTQYRNAQQNLKFNIKYLKGVFQNFSVFFHSDNIRKLLFFKDDELTFNNSDKSVKIKIDYKLNERYKIAPLLKGLHEQLCISNKERCLSDEWKRDEEKGGLQYLNFQKIAAQKGVIKHILSQMGRNLLSGKSILSLSLPVQIFSGQSHLQRLLHSFRMAPTFFEKYQLIKSADLKMILFEQLLASSAAFGISTSLLYLSQEKSFNPLLGETCQMWIDGCPAYAEQISHHPPISSIYFIGRGYKIYGQLQAKVELGLNTGKGSNSGQIIVEFDSGIKVYNYFSSGEVSGLSYGKRKFNLIGKSYHFIEDSSIYLSLDFDESKKKGKHNEDQFHGKFFETTTLQIEEFRKHKKFKNARIHKVIGQSKKLSGIWNKYVQFQEKLMIDFDSVGLSCMSRDCLPLPSDSVWRSDIAYKRLNNQKQAQQFKQILQEKQRNDRRLRTSN